MAGTVEIGLTKGPDTQSGNPLHKNPCAQLYVPTKLEWLAVWCNMVLKQKRTVDDYTTSVSFSQEPPSTLIIHIHCYEPIPLSWLEEVAKSYGIVAECKAEELGIFSALVIKARFASPD